MDTKQLFIKCTNCGHYEPVNKNLFAKILGGAVAGFGYWAWISFLFAGTGFALPICIAIMVGGVSLVAFADKVVGWLNKMYPCPECGKKVWVSVTYEEHMKEKELERREQQIKEKEQQLQEKDEIIRSKDEQIASFIAEKEKNSSKDNETLTRDDLKREFHTGICHAKNEIDIYVPKLGNGVFGTESFKQEVLGALERGCLIKIRCGFADKKDELERSRMQRSIDRFVSDGRFAAYHTAGQLRFKIDDAHAKLAIFDEDYYLIGSMNFLSNPGDDMLYNGQIRHKWEEIGEKSVNINNLYLYRGKYFNF